MKKKIMAKNHIKINFHDKKNQKFRMKKLLDEIKILKKIIRKQIFSD